MKKKLLLVLFLLPQFCFSQRAIPYPIIFVHGWTGNDATWYAMGVHLNSFGLKVNLDHTSRRGGNGSKLDFHLNADGTTATSKLVRSGTGNGYYGDVFDYQSQIDPSADVFFVNFDNPFSNTTAQSYSNQAAVVKQGFAVGLAVKNVLKATGAKKVILFGHSMGGLAIREYIQNPINWQDGFHHVAKVVTTGTPHWGSNSSSLNLSLIFTGGNEFSEAVRDLRWPNGLFRGTYLFGGNETDLSSLGTHNRDVDCDGFIGNSITGLNSRSLPGGVSYDFIIGTTPFSSGDGIVDANRATCSNIYDIGKDWIATSSSEESSAQEFYSSTDSFWHTKLTKQRWINTYALDESDSYSMATEVDHSKTYRAFFTPSPSGNIADTDLFNVSVPQRGVLSFSVKASQALPIKTGIYTSDSDHRELTTGIGVSESSCSGLVQSGGTYVLKADGIAKSTGAIWEFNPYAFSTTFCPLPPEPSITNSGNTILCEGQILKLNATPGYDIYRWTRNGEPVPVSGNEVLVSQPGFYAVEAGKCNRLFKSTTGPTVQVNPVPATPIIAVAGNKLRSSSSTGNQWYLNGQPIVGATQQELSGFGTGAYSVMVSLNGCSAVSSTFAITSTPEDELSGVQVFPNPTQGIFTVKGIPSGGNLAVWSPSGQVIERQSSRPGVSTQQINLSNYPSGIYLIEVRGKDAVFLKLLKQ